MLTGPPPKFHGTRDILRRMRAKSNTHIKPRASETSGTGRDFTRIGVGTGRAGIAYIFARSGYQVGGVKIGEEPLERSRHIANSTGRGSIPQVSEQEHTELINRITPSSDMDSALIRPTAVV